MRGTSGILKGVTAALTAIALALGTGCGELLVPEGRSGSGAGLHADRMAVADQFLHPGDVIRQVLDRHGCIFDERHRLKLAAHAHQQPDSRLAHPGHVRHLLRRDRRRHAALVRCARHPLA